MYKIQRKYSKYLEYLWLSSNHRRANENIEINLLAYKWTKNRRNVINVERYCEMVTLIDCVNINYTNILGSYLVIRLANIKNTYPF